MGNHCLRSKAAGESKEDHELPQTKVESCDTILNTARVEIIRYETTASEQWVTKDLKAGSSIPVVTSKVNNYWIWERSWEQSKPRWCFRLNPQENLYITYDDSNNVTMQPPGSNSQVLRNRKSISSLSRYFYVNAGEHGGVIFQVPNEQRYIAEREGKLTLTNTPTEWSTIVDVEHDNIKAKKRAIVIISEEMTSNKWICDIAQPGAAVVVDAGYDKSFESQWFCQHVDADQAWHFQARKNENLFVTCTAKNNEISLEFANNENRRDRLVKGKGEDSVIMLDITGKKYFYRKSEGRTSTLALTDKERLATAWQYMLYAFDVDGHIEPPEFGYDRAECKEVVSQEQFPQPQHSQESK